jgi:hypothetical protein
VRPSRALAASAALVGVTAATTTAHADPTSAWEADVFAGYGQVAFPSLDTTNVSWSNGGPAAALSAAFRGPHFTHPFVDLSYIPILSSGRDVSTTTQAGAVESAFVRDSSWAWGLAIGPGWDVDWLRIRVGVGLYDIFVKTEIEGRSDTATQLSLGFLAGLGAMVWRAEPFAVGIEARLVALQHPIAGIYQSMWSIGVSGRWDFSRR